MFMREDKCTPGTLYGGAFLCGYGLYKCGLQAEAASEKEGTCLFPWWSPACADDLTTIAAQLGKAPRGICAVARRCRFGAPQVVVTSPVVWGPGRRSERRAGVTDNDARVFPTTYWLTCPHLAVAVGRLESAGYTGRLRQWLVKSGLTGHMAHAHARAAQERLALVEPAMQERLQQAQPAQWQVLASAGIGGTRAQEGVKCLHAHLADYLAGPCGAERALAQADGFTGLESTTGARNPVGARVLALLLHSGVDTTGWPGCKTCSRRSTGESGAMQTPCYVAALDVGTNSCRLLLTTMMDDELVASAAALVTTRLGAGLQASGRLAPDAVERTVNGLRTLQQTVTGQTMNAPVQMLVVATNAVRSAANPEDLLVPAWEQLGLAVRVVQGTEEAALSFDGAIAGLGGIGVPNEQRGQANKSDEEHSVQTPDSMQVSVLDIGGGSTELVTGFANGTVVWAGSVDLGAVRLTELSSGADKLADLVETAQKYLASYGHEPVRRFVQGGILVGVGGTCTSLAAIDLGLAEYRREKVQGHTLARDRIKEMADNLWHMTLEQRRGVPGLQPERADIIVAGAAILLASMQVLQVTQITVSDSDILLGVARQFQKACVRAGFAV